MSEITNVQNEKFGTLGLAFQKLVEDTGSPSVQALLLDPPVRRSTKATTSKQVKKDPGKSTLFISEGADFVATVVKKLDYGLVVRLGDTGPTAICATRDLTGGTFENRKSRYSSLGESGQSGPGSKITVRVTRVRPAKEGQSSPRIDVSEKVIQDEAVRSHLMPGDSTTAGTMVQATVKEVRDGYALLEISDGPGKGFVAMLHATEVPGQTRKERDQFITSLNGEKADDAATDNEAARTLEAEVIEVGCQGRGDLEIKLSLQMGLKRDRVKRILALPSAEGGEGATVTGAVTNLKPFGFFVEIEGGPANGCVALVHLSQMPGGSRDEKDQNLVSFHAFYTGKAEAEMTETDSNNNGEPVPFLGRVIKAELVEGGFIRIGLRPIIEEASADASDNASGDNAGGSIQ